MTAVKKGSDPFMTRNPSPGEANQPVRRVRGIDPPEPKRFKIETMIVNAALRIEAA
jgi:hypothetical protein